MHNVPKNGGGGLNLGRASTCHVRFGKDDERGCPNLQHFLVRPNNTSERPSNVFHAATPPLREGCDHEDGDGGPSWWKSIMIQPNHHDGNRLRIRSASVETEDYGASGVINFYLAEMPAPLPAMIIPIGKPYTIRCERGGHHREQHEALTQRGGH